MNLAVPFDGHPATASSYHCHLHHQLSTSPILVATVDCIGVAVDIRKTTKTKFAAWSRHHAEASVTSSTDEDNDDVMTTSMNIIVIIIDYHHSHHHHSSVKCVMNDGSWL